MIDVALAVGIRGVKKSFGNLAFVLPALMFPVIFFVGFAGALSGVDQLPGFDYAPGYETFQFGFVMLQSAAMAGVFTGFGIAQDFERGKPHEVLAMLALKVFEVAPARIGGNRRGRRLLYTHRVQPPAGIPVIDGGPLVL